MKVLDAKPTRSANEKSVEPYTNEAEVDETRSKDAQNGDLNDPLKRANTQTNGDINIVKVFYYLYYMHS